MEDKLTEHLIKHGLNEAKIPGRGGEIPASLSPHAYNQFIDKWTRKMSADTGLIVKYGSGDMGENAFLFSTPKGDIDLGRGSVNFYSPRTTGGDVYQFAVFGSTNGLFFSTAVKDWSKKIRNEMETEFVKTFGVVK